MPSESPPCMGMHGESQATLVETKDARRRPVVPGGIPFVSPWCLGGVRPNVQPCPHMPRALLLPLPLPLLLALSEVGETEQQCFHLSRFVVLTFKNTICIAEGSL